MVLFDFGEIDFEAVGGVEANSLTSFMGCLAQGVFRTRFRTLHSFLFRLIISDSKPFPPIITLKPATAPNVLLHLVFTHKSRCPKSFQTPLQAPSTNTVSSSLPHPQPSLESKNPIPQFSYYHLINPFKPCYSILYSRLFPISDDLRAIPLQLLFSRIEYSNTI